MSRRLCCLVVLAVLVVSNSVSAQVSRAGLVTPTALRRAGLTRSWFTQVEVDRSIGRIAHITQHISTSRLQWIYQVVTQRGSFSVSELQLDQFGKPLGRVGAAERAADRIVDIIRFKQQRMAKGDAMADELEAIKQAAEQVIQNVADYRKKRDALDDEVNVSKKDLTVPLLQRVKAKPDLYPQLVQRIVPQITLYVATDRGVVHAIDAETGQTRWAMPIGRPDHPNMEPAANERFVAVVNGSHIYVVDSQDGKFVWQRRLKSAPGAGPAIYKSQVFIPMVNGLIESFDLGKLARNFQDDEEDLQAVYQEAKYFRSIGRSMVQPLATPNGTIAWPTDRGHLYVIDGPQMRPRFRVIANRDIVSRPTYLPPNKLFVASIDGYVHCVDEKTGSIIWPFSTGEPISQSPVPIGDSVFVITDDRNLFCISAADRRERWFVPHIKQFLTASEKRVYVLADTGRMLVLDRKTGGRITSVDLGQIDLKFINMQSDRLFLGMSTGLIQCLHEPKYRLPLLHAEDEQYLQQRQDIVNVPRPVPGGGVKPPVGAGGGAPDPFGAGDAPDPFGVGDKPDPFGPKKPPAGGGGTAPNPFDTKPPASGVPDPFG